jgi:hypothetical protein
VNILIIEEKAFYKIQRPILIKAQQSRSFLNLIKGIYKIPTPIAGRVAPLPSKCEALSSNPSTERKKKTNQNTYT